LSFVEISWTKTDRCPGPSLEEETKYWVSISRGFTSDRIPKATKEFNVHLFIHSLISRVNSLRTMPWQPKTKLHHNLSLYAYRLEKFCFEVVMKIPIHKFAVLFVERKRSAMFHPL
jgi:hypothetical protein